MERKNLGSRFEFLLIDQAGNLQKMLHVLQGNDYLAPSERGLCQLVQGRFIFSVLHGTFF